MDDRSRPKAVQEEHPPDHGTRVADQGREEHRRHERMMYGRFLAMIATSTVVMFLLTYTNVYSARHIHWSQERFYMALLMGAAMAIVMLAFMWRPMYHNRRANTAIVVGAVVVAALAFFWSRSQSLIGDQEYMRAMIPHHSIAILTSERASLDDLRVQRLADGISATQRKEIKEMDWLIQDIEKNGKATTVDEAVRRPVPEFNGNAELENHSDSMHATLATLWGVDD